LIDFLIRKWFRILVKGALIIFANGEFAGLNGFAIFIALLIGVNPLIWLNLFCGNWMSIGVVTGGGGGML
jgi:hypothetical protein